MNGYRFDVEFTFNKNIDFEVQQRLMQEVAQYVNKNHKLDPILNVNREVGKEKIRYAADRIGDWRKITIQLIISPNQVDDNFDPNEFKVSLKDHFKHNENFERVEKRNVTAL
jgi:hypothetical protein